MSQTKVGRVVSDEDPLLMDPPIRKVNMETASQDSPRAIELLVLKRDIVGSPFSTWKHPITTALLRANCSAPSFDGNRAVFKHTVTGQWLRVDGLFWVGCKLSLLRMCSWLLDDNFVMAIKVTGVPHNVSLYETLCNLGGERGVHYRQMGEWAFNRLQKRR